MKIEIKTVLKSEKEILRNLLEKYSYEFSQYTKIDVNPLGLYGYTYLDYYWTEKSRWAYFIIVDNTLAGFVMVIDMPEVDDIPADFQIAEFFVMHKYRKQGIGRKAVFEVFDKHHGKWQLKTHPNNVASCIFWTKVIEAYTNGNYELIKSYPNTAYDDGTLGNIYFFDNSQV
jgi:predicted acetyltransferase